MKVKLKGEIPTHLTPRQVTVVLLKARGYSDKQVAKWLDISMFTTKRHIADIKERLGATNITQAVVLCIIRGITDGT